MAIVFDNKFLFTKLSFFIRLKMSFYSATSYVISCMVVLIEMISNWVTQSVVANGYHMFVDSKSELCTRFTYVIALSVTTFIACYQVHHI